MNRASFAYVCCIAALAVTACNQNGRDSAPKTTEAETANEQPPVNIDELDPTELPPMVVRSPAYRCTDGNALYVDVLSDENAVTVRDSRSDVPVRLTRDSSAEPFTGEERTLSGTGAEVRYSSPERPNQTCREPSS